MQVRIKKVLAGQSAGVVEYVDCISAMSVLDMRLSYLMVRLQSLSSGE